MRTDFFDFYSPTRLMAGAAMVDSLGQELKNMGWSRCFLITDQLLKKTGLVDRVLDALKMSSVQVVGIFDEVVPNSEVALVERGAAAAREAEPDVLLALGGGSSMDTAKAINILLCNGGSLLDYEGFGLLSSPLTPLVAIPTTAGTGSEMTQFAVIKDDSRRAKLTFLSPYLIPRIAVLDPELTLGLPPGLTAATGMDALTHAVEAHLSTASNPVASGLALFCLLGGMVFNDADMVEALGVVTGEDWTIEQLMECGERIWCLKRSIGNLCGVTDRDDMLPGRMLTPLEEGSCAGSVPNIEMMLREYYQLRGLDARGRVLPERLKQLGLKEITSFYG